MKHRFFSTPAITQRFPVPLWSFIGLDDPAFIPLFTLRARLVQPHFTCVFYVKTQFLLHLSQSNAKTAKDRVDALKILAVRLDIFISVHPVFHNQKLYDPLHFHSDYCSESVGCLHLSLISKVNTKGTTLADESMPSRWLMTTELNILEFHPNERPIDIWQYLILTKRPTHPIINSTDI